MPSDYSFAPECAGCPGREQECCPVFLAPKREWRKPGGCRAKGCEYWNELWTCPKCGKTRYFFQRVKGEIICLPCSNAKRRVEPAND